MFAKVFLSTINFLQNYFTVLKICLVLISFHFNCDAFKGKLHNRQIFISYTNCIRKFVCFLKSLLLLHFLEKQHEYGENFVIWFCAEKHENMLRKIKECWRCMGKSSLCFFLNSILENSLQHFLCICVQIKHENPIKHSRVSFLVFILLCMKHQITDFYFCTYFVFIWGSFLKH